MNLSFGLNFDDLYSTGGIQKIDQLFLDFLQAEDGDISKNLIRFREAKKLSDIEFSNFIINTAPFVDKFVAKLFGVESQLSSLKDEHNNFKEIYRCKRNFVQRIVARDYKDFDFSEFDKEQSFSELVALIGSYNEYNYAKFVNQWLEDKENNHRKIEVAAKFAAWVMFTEKGKDEYRASILFHIPKKTDPENLIDIKKSEEIIYSGCNHLDSRDSFSLTDKGASLEEALDQASYCIYCHARNKDSCSKGLEEKNEENTKYKENYFGESLSGCPLEEKISEMNFLKDNGFVIGSLAAATIDNPLLAATGHRICNDCMKSCIYQKQEPVNIPKIESRVLRDVLNLDWGFEIYSLLTRWSPLHLERPYPKNETNKNILVVGLGPAGFNLSHHLLNDGHNIVAIDGLKIEPLASEISGIKLSGQRAEFKPIKRIEDIQEDLDKRVPGGFGGVAEYGITVRWDKNNLKIIRLLLERRKNFRMYGGTRFGSQINYNTAKNLGFDHISLAMGAGRPNLLDINNGFVNGVRTASDFLMALQLTGAARENSFANMQIRLPILVIGGGLTAIDAATESVAYYVRQVKKFRQRHHELIKIYGEGKVRNNWSDQDKEVAEEYLAHAELFVEEDIKASEENRDKNYISIIRNLGGVNILYRKRFIDAPCYRLNPEEVGIALREGIGFIEKTVPEEILIDKYNSVQGLRAISEGKNKIYNAKTIFLAIGTSPNTVAAKEDEENFVLDGKYFRAVDRNNEIVTPERSVKPGKNYPLIRITEDNFAVSFFGDLHPSYSGNVVKAMASAKNGYPQISSVLEKRTGGERDLQKSLDDQLIPRVQKINILSEKIIEVIIYAPLAAEKFQPGQFYRLQNYESKAVVDSAGSKLAMEGLAMTGAWVDVEKGLISLIALEMGGSSDLIRYLKKGEEVVLMGPTGEPTTIEPNEKVVLFGGGLGNAVLFSIGKAFREAGSKVLYFAGYKKLSDLYKREEIEAAADQVIWCCDEGQIEPSRSQDQSFEGNIVQAAESYSSGELKNNSFSFAELSRIITIGSDRMMDAINHARKENMSKCFPKNYKAIASINSPMQCMMKEICAQCIQKHVDPYTGLESYVYSCFNQDQDMNQVDFKHLNNRLGQNNLLEKQTVLWLNKSLTELGMRK
ncbi:MAG: FAD-dependent oxidoreductase [Rickettsiales bacterium]